MSCNCKCDILKSDATVAVDSGTLVATTQENLNPLNEGRIAFRVINSVPQGGMSLPVAISLDGGTTRVSVLDKYGNALYGYGIRPYAVLKGYYGTNGIGGSTHIQLVNYPYYRQPRM